MKVDVSDIKFSYFRPAIIVEKLKAEEEDEKIKLNLFAPNAVIRFNLIKLIRGEISVSAVNLESPSLYLEVKSDTKPIDLKDINITKIVDNILKAKLEGAKITNANFRIKINGSNDKNIDISTPKLDIEFYRGLISNYVIKLNAENILSPIEYLSSIYFQMDVKNKLIKIEKLNMGFIGGKSAVTGFASNLSDVSQLKLDLSWHVDFNLDESKKYSKILKFKSGQDYPGGFLSANGKYSGQIFKNFKESTIDGDIRVKGFSWSSYKIPQMEIAAKYSKNQILLSKFDVSDGTKSIEIQETAISMGTPYSIKGKGYVHDIELSKYLELFNIKHCLSYFTIGGPFTFSGSVKPEFKISGLFDLKIKDFWILKEKGLLPTKANSILDFKNGSVYGFVHFSSKGAYFDNFVAKSENNSMVVSGWIRDTETVELDVKSDTFSMNTYGRIADLPLKGYGTLSTKLIVDENGDFKNEGQISFKESELLDSYYLGSIDTKIIYDKDILSFKDVKGKVGSSNYTGYTELRFDKTPGPTMKGYGTVTDAYSEDIYKLFRKQKKLPGTPSGLVNATVKFDGYPSWNTIKLDSKLRVRGVELFSERFTELVANFIWDKGDLSVNDLYLIKGKGRLDFKGIRKNEHLHMNVISKNLVLSDFAILSKRNTELNGGVNIKGDVEQNQKNLSGNIKFNRFDLIIGKQKLKPVDFNLTLGQHISVKFNIFDQEAQGEIIKEDNNTYVLRSKFKKFNFFPIGSLILKDIENFTTDMDGEIEVRLTDKFVIKSAKIRIDSL
ncbi:MAG: hypothetical protein NTY22_08125, partial [Proteobacteria bacterium]|nr:hypothetical protein [Pseudomonadota bacterium]